MAGPTKLPTSGYIEEYPARSHNLFVDGYNRQHASLGRGGQTASGPGPIQVCKAQNVTETLLTRGFCVALEKLVQSFDDRDTQVYGGTSPVKANKPTDDLRHSILGVSLGTVDKGAVDDEANGGIGSFQFGGPCWLRCNVTSTDHDFVKLDSPQTTYSELAISADAGAPILDTETDATGEQWVYALLGSPGAGPTTTQKALLIKPVPAATYAVSISGGDATAWTAGITPASMVTAAVIRLVDGDTDVASAVATDGLAGFRDSDNKLVVYDAVNCVATIDGMGLAGDGTSGEYPPLLIEGYVRKYTDGPDIKEVFQITDMFDPLTVVTGEAVGAVTGSDFIIDNVVDMYGRKFLGDGDGQIHCTNPQAWDADDNAVTTAVGPINTDGDFLAIQIACPA